MTTSYDLGALKQPDEIGAGRDPRDIILPQPGFKTVLANRDFRLIWSAQVASQLADKVRSIQGAVDDLEQGATILCLEIEAEEPHGPEVDHR